MAKYFLLGGKKVGSVLLALSASLLLITGCDEVTKQDPKNAGDHNANIINGGLPVGGMPYAGGGVIPDVPPLVGPGAAWSTIELMVRVDPAEPENEHFLDDWRFEIYTIDDQARPTSPSFFGETGPDGNALIGLPSFMFALPIEIAAHNDVYPPFFEDDDPIPGTNGSTGPTNPTGAGEGGVDHPTDNGSANGGTVYRQELEDPGVCREFHIFVPAYCYDKAVWLLGPFEDALWRYYREAARHRGESWNPSQVDCGTWLANMQLLLLTDRVSDELNDLSDTEFQLFNPEALILALQENQHLLTPTRPPICMAERRHNGGGMERGDIINDEDEGDNVVIDDNVFPWAFEVENVFEDDDPILVNIVDGLVADICEINGWDDQELFINGNLFVGQISYYLDDPDFMGVITDDLDIGGLNVDISSYNTRLGNGYPLDSDVYDDACALTNIIEFTNNNDDEIDVVTGTGAYFYNLFGDGGNTSVWLTSDGDTVVDDNDYWAIFYDNNAPFTDDCISTRVLAVELIGHRQEDFRDVLHMTFDLDTDNLFLGLRADYELNEEEVDGERAFLAYTISSWDGTTEDGRRRVRRDIANCYQAADVWARQFFVTLDFDHREGECCFEEECIVDSTICPLEAAEFAVRSQCFSNSRSNQRWRTDDVGYWSMNSDHSVPGDIIVNAGWLAPHQDFEIYVQKFDEAVFKGPRTIRTTDHVGQLMVELPTLVEGDRVLIKAEDSCCDDYDLVIPCVPEFTGFAGLPGIPYTPVTVGPALPPPGPIPGPGPVPVPVP